MAPPLGGRRQGVLTGFDTADGNKPVSCDVGLHVLGLPLAWQEMWHWSPGSELTSPQATMWNLVQIDWEHSPLESHT